MVETSIRIKIRAATSTIEGKNEDFLLSDRKQSLRKNESNAIITLSEP